jgi:hypothetical protein
MNELPRSWSIARTTGTHADIFATVGLARVLSSTGGRARIAESQTGFTVSIDGSDATTLTPSPGYPFLKTNEKVTVPHGALDPVDYKAEKAKADRIRTLRQGKRLKALDEATKQAIEQDKPRPDWRLLQVLNTLQGDETTNRVHALIVKMSAADFGKKVVAALEALVEKQPSKWDWPATSVQLFNPIAAKGYSRLKPDSTDRNDKTKDQWTDPFIEWLRYQGYFAVACPFFQGPKSEHVRLLCPVPHDISVNALSFAAAELRAAGLFGGPAKLDSLAVLKLAEILIRHSQEYHDADVDVFDDFALKGRTPADAISSITVTHYQSLGNAKAVSAMSTIGLPGWFPLVSAERAQKMLEILFEHQTVLRTLQDDHSDEMGLLVMYRRFLQTRGEPAAETLVDFLGRYGAMLLGAWQEGRRLRAFRTDNVKELLMATNPRLSEVLKNHGFQAVAGAVRRATVNAQALKAMNQPGYREIRYDLLPELRRKASLPGPQPLVQAVSDFISKYNVENARRREMKKSAPRNVTTEEFADFVALVESAGAATVGAMLCAYGSCREPRDEETSQEPPSQ